MNAMTAAARSWGRWSVCVFLALLAAGCATPKIDWASRVGIYTFDQAVVDFGPPDKQARLQDGTLVADWLTRRGYTHVYPSSGFYPWGWYGPVYPAYIDTYTTPDYFLRLTFGPDGRLKAWKRFAR